MAASPSEVLAEMNYARTNPAAYAQVVAQTDGVNDSTRAEAIRFLQHTSPLPPLLSSSGLSQSAEVHVSTQGPTGSFGHAGNTFSRMNRFGQRVGSAGENISYGKREARSIVCQLIVDRQVSGRGHRKNIFSRNFGVAGVAYGSHARYGAMCVIDFAGRYVERGSTLAGL